MITITGFISTLAALFAVAVFGRLALGLGYKTAWLPLICSIMYFVLNLDWLFFDRGEIIGTYLDLAWNFVEVGLLAGTARLAWSLRKSFEEFCEIIKKGLERDD